MITDEQREFRRDKIGGSDAAAACGVSEFRTPLQLWREKKGLEVVKTNIAMRRGNYLEPLLIELYKEQSGEAVNQPSNTFTHPAYPWMIANLDGITSSGKILECKTTTMFGDKWGEDGSDYIPDDYVFQLQHYCSVTGIDKAVLIVLDGFNNVRTYNYKSSQEIEDKLIVLESKFHDCLINDIEPVPISIGDYIKHSEKLKPEEFIHNDGEVNNLLDYYKNVKENEKTIKEKLDYVKLMLLRKMDKASVILDVNGKTLVDLRRGRFNVNYKNLENLV